MKKRHLPFRGAAWALTLAGGLAACFLMRGDTFEHAAPAVKMVWNGAAFAVPFLLGWLGLQLWICLPGRTRVVRPRGWKRSFVLALIFLFVTGAAGQGLFMIHREEGFSAASQADVILLLDASGSMEQGGRNISRTEAACQFVDGLGKNCRLTAASFAAVLLDNSPMVDMDQQGKETVKNFIQSIDSVGATDFNGPLDAAREALEGGRKGARRVVILLTDGEGELDASLAESYKNSGTQAFTVRIAEQDAASGRALAEFAEKTGGFDTLLVPASNGSVDTKSLLEAFQAAMEAVTEGRVVMDGDPMLRGGSVSLYQLAVRLAALTLCGLLFGWGYFGKLWQPGAWRNLLWAPVLDLLLFALSGVQTLGGLQLFCLLFVPAYVRIEEEGGEVIDV